MSLNNPQTSVTEEEIGPEKVGILTVIVPQISLLSFYFSVRVFIFLLLPQVLTIFG